MTSKTAYTLKEVANDWLLSGTALDRLIKTGDLTPAKVGGQTLIHHADLLAPIERGVAAWREGQGRERD